MKNRTALIFIFALLSLCSTLYAQQPESITVTISASGSTSTAANLAGCTPAAIVMPAAWTSASVAFSASVNGTDFFNVYDQYGARTIITASTSQWITLSPADTWSFRHVKLVSVNSSGSAVTQDAARDMTIICRK